VEEIFFRCLLGFIPLKLKKEHRLKYDIETHNSYEEKCRQLHNTLYNQLQKNELVKNLRWISSDSSMFLQNPITNYKKVKDWYLEPSPSYLAFNLSMTGVPTIFDDIEAKHNKVKDIDVYYNGSMFFTRIAVKEGRGSYIGPKVREVLMKVLKSDDWEPVHKWGRTKLTTCYD